jgi:glycosyltransferase involved in cell wall biosynthesis
VLVPVRDALAMADAVQTLIGDTTRRQQMGAAGRALAEREFTVEKVVDTHLDIYREMVSMRAPK